MLSGRVRRYICSILIQKSVEIGILKHEAVAVFIARVFLGFLFFFQGFDAVFRVKLSGVIATIEPALRNRGIPKFIIVTGAYFTSFIELLAGLCLIVGLVKSYALYLLGLDLLLASIIFGLIKPMWDMQFVFPRLALLLFLLIVPANWDTLSIDHLFINNY